jgi:hypothetical protein
VRLALAAVLTAAAVAPAGAQQDAARAGELILERPTILSLGFEWRIEGDANGNATGHVQYRPVGTTTWRTALPMMRLGLGYRKEMSMIGRGWQYTIPDAVAGSIMDLAPGTEYEVRLELRDPDGATGDAVKTLKLRTRAEPVVPAQPVEVRHVYPPDYKGEKQKPAFENIMHAVNGYPPICDTYQTIHSNAAKPGTVIKVHGGVHTYDNNLYWKGGKPQYSYWLHGIVTLVASGTAEQPIYIVGAGDGEAILDGAGAGIFLNVRSADYLHFEGLTIRNAGIALFGGFQGERGGGCKGLTVRNCWFEDIVTGLMAQDGRSEDFTILDNVFLGRNPADKLGHFGSTTAGYAVNLGGQGHAVGYNYAAQFWDGINVFTSALADPETGQQARAIDFCNNDIHNCSDQFIETDGGYGNIRVLRNRMFNCPSQPISSQVIHAGPVYFIRNILWNTHGGKANFKEHSGAQAFVFLHNTSSTHMATPFLMSPPPDKMTWWIQNNLPVGPTNVKTMVRHLPGQADARHRASNNAYRANVPGAEWIAGKESFPSLDALRAATGQEAGSILVDGYDVFAGATEPPHARSGTPLVYPATVDVALRPGSAPVDAGLVIPGVNDNFTGRAPDLGAHEAGQPAPVYGPRNGPYLSRLEEVRTGTYIPGNVPEGVEPVAGSGKDTRANPSKKDGDAQSAGEDNATE